MQQLATMMGEGIQAAFDQPPLAIYCQRNASDHQVELTVAHTLSAGLGLRPGMGLGRERPSAAPWSHRPP